MTTKLDCLTACRGTPSIATKINKWPTCTVCRSTTVVDLRTVARLYRDVHVRVPTTTVFLFVDLLSGVLVTAFAPHFESNLEKK